MKALVAITVIAIAGVASAQKQQPPALAQPRPYALPEHRDVALDNGAKVTTIAFGAVPKAMVQLHVRGGTGVEREDQIWLATLVANALQEGTKSRTAAQLAQAAAELGGNLEISVSNDELVLSLEVLSEFTPQAVTLIADVARNPGFPEANVGRVKADLLRRLAVAKTTTRDLAANELAHALYAGHPYSHVLPTEDMLKGYTVAQVREFYQAHVGAAASHLYVAGKFDDAEVNKAARDALASWTRGADYVPIAVAPRAAPALRVVDRPGAVQSTLAIGLPVVSPASPDYVKLLVVNAMLGGSFTSRITTNIREQKGYTYSPFSYVSTDENNASWQQWADVTTNVTGASLTEIFKEVNGLRAKPPSATELKGTQAYLAGTFVLRNATRAGIIQQLSFVERHGLGEDYLRGFVQRVWAVTPADLQDATAKYLDPKQMTIVVVGDRKVIDRQLTAWKR